MKAARRPRFAPRNEVISSTWQDPARGLRALPDKYFDHFITDPPYSEYVHRNKWSGSTEGNDTATPTPVTFRPLSLAELREAAGEIVRVTKGWVLVFCADDDIVNWREALTSAGALRWPGLIWTKPNGTPQFRGEGPSQPCEHIVSAWCGAPNRPVWNGGGKQGHYDVPTEGKDRTNETQKPHRLMEHLVLDFTRPGDLVGDAYAGSGTTGVAAKVCGREFVLWEERPEQAAAAVRRLAKAKEQLRLELLYHARESAFGGEQTKPPAAEQHAFPFLGPKAKRPRRAKSATAT